MSSSFRFLRSKETSSSRDEGENGEGGAMRRDCTQDWKKAPCWKRLTFSWATPLVNQAFRREISANELWELWDEHKAKGLAKRLEIAWKDEISKNGEGEARMYRAVWAVFWPGYMRAFVYKMLWLVAVVVTNTVLVVELLNLLEETAAGTADTVQIGNLKVPPIGFLYAALFFVGEVARSTLVNQHWAWTCLTGINARGAVASLLFQKTTRLRQSGDAIGQLLNMIGNDIERIREAFTYGLFIVSTPIALLAIIGVGIWVLGYAILAGMVVLILSVPLQAKIADKTGRLRRKAIKITDERVTLMNEILKAAQLIKLYAWEKSFVEKVADVRRRELVQIRLTTYVKAINTAFVGLVPLLTTFVAFFVHTIILGEELTPQQAFSTLALFNVARFPLAVLPLSVRFGSEVFVSLRRIGDYLLLEEIDPETSTQRTDPEPGKSALEFSQALFTWESKKAFNPEESMVLKVGDLEIPEGCFCCIAGNVGSGKSSFLAGALLGDMRRVEGMSLIRGQTVAYCGQDPWVFNATFRDNILFGQPYDEENFKKAIQVAALQPDLENLPSGVMTELGERGINVSGGQKARLALARAVYSDADIYLFDDILSAVDAHVAAHIWKHCIRGALRGKTILLATHGLRYLPHADFVLVFDDMKLVTKGTFNDLKDGPFRHIVNSSLTNSEQSNRSKSGTGRAETSIDKIEATDDIKISEQDNESTERGKIMTEEDRKAGSVSGKTVRTFTQNAGGPCLLSLVFLLFWLSEGSKNASDAWLTAWTEDVFDRGESFYNIVYAALVAGFGILMITRGIIFGAVMLRASQGLHNLAFMSCMKARIDFFQTTPLGRILARFSADIDKVDTLLVDVAEVCCSLLVRVFLAILVITIVLPAFLIAIVPLIFLYVKLLNYFRRVVRQMKRIDSISRSPLISQVQSLVHGLTDARAYGTLERDVAKNLVFVDASSKGYCGFYFSNRWIGFRLDFITTAVVTVSATLCIFFASEISSGLAGLVLTSALSTAGILQFATRQAAELEAQFTSVERLRFFIESTPVEHDTIGNDEKVDSDTEKWITKGTVKFENFSMRYRQGLPLVLKGLNLELKGGQSNALVGRSGSGKSSTLLSLFRVLEAADGRITIDNVDIAKIPLALLRGKLLAIVPQSPTLFTGTIRYNLDPFGEHSDGAIMDALRLVHLENFIETFSLDHQLTEGGLNISAGQRQLLAFARALLKKAIAICVDEGTSSVDETADAMVQETLSTACKGTTLIIVAHRLASTRDCDQICVLESGELLEAGPPHLLLADPNSAYTKLWKANNKTSH